MKGFFLKVLRGFIVFPLLGRICDDYGCLKASMRGEVYILTTYL